MSPLIEGAFKAIESDDPQVVSDGFLTLAEVVAVNRIQGFQSDIIPEANNEILEWAPLEQIQKAVIRWIEAQPDHPCVSAAFWVLGKFRDKALKPFFRSWLDRYVARVLSHLAPTGQILSDLWFLEDKDTFGIEAPSLGYGKTLDEAVHYLKKVALHSPRK